MTLIITEVSRLGIAMTADSAYTPSGGGITQYKPKVFSSAKLGVGVSMWGNYLPAQPDQWVRAFLSKEETLGCPNIHTLASHLETDLRTACPTARPTPSLQATVGFHLAGYDSGYPVLYHVHNGVSQALAARGVFVNPQLINANPDLDLASSKTLMTSAAVASYLTRNGDYWLYAIMSSLLDPILIQLDPMRNGAGVTFSFGTLFVPGGKTLVDRANYLASQIRLVSTLLEVSNIRALLGTTGSHIGGDILALELDASHPPVSPRVVPL
jgi:hypothetical protein